MTREQHEIYPTVKADRRLAPDRQERGRSRRGEHIRYEGVIPVRLSREGSHTPPLVCSTHDFSNSGMLLRYPVDEPLPAPGDVFTLRFYLAPGMMPEGYESRVTMRATVVRVVDDPRGPSIAVHFRRNLRSYLAVKFWLRNILVSLMLLALAIGAMVWMRQTSIFYFTFNAPVYLYSIVATLFLLTRYMFAALYKPIAVDTEFMPGVSIIIPCYNEEAWIHRTIQSCVNQDYPPDRFEVLLVDDGSTDQSVEEAVKTMQRIRRQIPTARCRVLRQPRNLGKRHALAAGAMQARFDLVTFVDSDSFLEPSALREIVQPFKDPKMGAVAGRTDVYNKWTNYLTKMQAVRYYVAFRFFKAAESIFDAVTCLSGPLACYRKDLVLKYLEPWCAQSFLGKPATFGDDRSMTNFILAGARTCYQDTAICHTIVPSSFKQFIKQQMRWKRSWLRESIRAASFIWKKEPAMALSFYIGLMIPVLAPVVVLYALVFHPLMTGVFPTVYLLGLASMATLMSGAYLLLKKSDLWIYGFAFCLFYLGVLMWQMPWAVATFASSNWGTRPTSLDKNFSGGRTLPSPYTVQTLEVPILI
jgi:hyaluronan synthase